MRQWLAQACRMILCLVDSVWILQLRFLELLELLQIQLHLLHLLLRLRLPRLLVVDRT